MRGQRRADDEDRRRGLRNRLLLVVGGLAVLVVLAGLVLAYDIWHARAALVRAEEHAQDLRRHFSDGDVTAARSELAKLEDAARVAHSHTDGPLWSAVAETPFVGRDFAAVRTVSRVLYTISTDGLRPLVDIADRVNAKAFSPQDGRIDIDAIRSVTPGLQDSAAALTQGGRQLEQIDPEGLIGPLRGPVEAFQAKLDDARSTVQAGSKASQLIPDMLGGAERRTYALVFQNNAEIRSTGGLPGAFAILTAKEGRIRLGDQGAGSDFPPFKKLSVEPSQDEQRLYSTLLTRYWGDTTLTPDFPRGAEIMRAMIRKERDEEIDGVISVDPMALSYILEATGPVTLIDGSSLSSKNAVKRLLNDVYLEIPDAAARDAYFAAAARRVFTAVVSGKAGSEALIHGLAKGVGENRVLIESARPPEQRILASTRIAGALPGDEGTTPHVGIYYNDATETKLEYYLRKKTMVRAMRCTEEGAQSLIATTVLRSIAPRNARTLPSSILGPGTGEKRGSFRMAMTLYAPFGGEVTRLDIDGEEQPLNRAEHDGLQVVIAPVLLAPGQKMTVKASIVTGKDQRDVAVLTTTPGIEATPNNVIVPSACD